MILVGREVLNQYVMRNAVVRNAIAVWLVDVASATWQSHEDVKKCFPTSRSLPGRLVIFEFTYPAFTITAQLAYLSGVVVVLGVSERNTATIEQG